MSRPIACLVAALVSFSGCQPRASETAMAAQTSTLTTAAPVNVAIADVSVGPATVNLMGRTVTIPKPHLHVRVRMTATDPNQIIDYRVPASDDSRPVVTDEFGNTYRWSTADAASALSGRVRSIRPDEPLEDLYLFPAPLPAARTLTLRIPGQCFGKSPDIVATFPAPAAPPAKQPPDQSP